MSAKHFYQDAIESCDIYKKYCQQNQKSLVVTRVSQIKQGHSRSTFILKLINGSFHSFDSEAIKIVLDPEMMLSPSDYDDISLHYVKHDYFEFGTYLYKEQELSIKVKNDSVLKLFNGYLRDNPDRLCFVSDMTFLIDKVKSWYTHHHSKIDLPVCSSDALSFFEESSLSDTLSESQTIAVKKSLSAPVSYIWGPPGTGKTWTLAHSVLSLIKAKKKILIVAPTNNAVDNSLRTILHVMKMRGESTDSVIRWGLPTVSFEQEFAEVCAGSALSKMIDSYKSRIKECEYLLEQFNDAELFEKFCLSFREHRNQHIALKELLTSLNREYVVSDLSCRDISKELDSAKELLKSKKQFFDHYKQKSFSLAHRSKMRFSKDYQNKYNRGYASAQKEYDSANSVVSEISTRLSNAILVRDNVQSKIDSTQKELSFVFEAIQKLSLSFFGSFVSIEMVDAEICQREEAFKQLKTKEEILKDLDYFRDELSRIDETVERQKNQKRVFACTIDYLYAHYDAFFCEDDPINPPLRIDHIFIDEAAYLPFIKAGIAFSFNCPVTLCGDHKQLPPVCEMDLREIKFPGNELVFFWAQSSLYFPDIFEYSTNACRDNYFEAGDIMSDYLETAFLKNTFRFGDNLAKILDHFVYHNDFSGASTPTNIVVIDAPSPHKSIGDRSSEEEALAIKKYIQSIRPLDFVVVTPYKKQRDLLRKELKDCAAYRQISTIHAAQGLEWDTVIISVVDSSNPYFSNSGISIGRQVMNTAISRAIKNIVVVCDYHYWVSKAHSQLIGCLCDSSTELIES